LTSLIFIVSNRKEKFNAAVSQIKGIAKIRKTHTQATEEQEESINSVSKNSSGSNIFPVGSKLSEKHQEIRGLELRYRNIRAPVKAKLSHSSYISKSTLTNCVANAGLMVIGGTKIPSHQETNIDSKILLPRMRQQKASKRQLKPSEIQYTFDSKVVIPTTF